MEHNHHQHSISKFSFEDQSMVNCGVYQRVLFILNSRSKRKVTLIYSTLYHIFSSLIQMEATLTGGSLLCSRCGEYFHMCRACEQWYDAETSRSLQAPRSVKWWWYWRQQSQWDREECWWWYDERSSTTRSSLVCLRTCDCSHAACSHWLSHNSSSLDLI